MNPYDPRYQQEEPGYLDGGYPPTVAQPSMFSAEENENLVKWQLDIKEELQRIEHLLRKHVPRTDKEGNVYYESPSKEEQLFNERGINEILNVLAWYLNKNIVLSNFDGKTINQRIDQFTRYLTDFIFMNYREFGLDTLEKMKHYPMIVMNIANTVEASYMRAFNGGERQSLREARSVVQSESLNQFQQQAPPNQNKFSLLKPTTWVRRN